ncbi:MAG: hypothetical protein DIU66_005860 [Bacillota bacterium]
MRWDINMFLDFIGIFLTTLIVNPRYFLKVILVGFIANIIDILAAIVFDSQVTEVISGGIFSSVNYLGNNILVPYFCPLILISIGLGLKNGESIDFWRFINPLASYKRPWPIIFLKVGLARILVLYIFKMGK